MAIWELWFDLKASLDEKQLKRETDKIQNEVIKKSQFKITPNLEKRSFNSVLKTVSTESQKSWKQAGKKFWDWFAQEASKSITDSDFFARALSWIAVTAVWASFIKLWTNLEQTRVSFEALTWSVENADRLIRDLAEFAKETPFELVWLRQTASQLLAFGIEQDEIIETLKRLWDVASWVNKPIEQIANAYWQVRTANQLYWTELLQFTQAWVPLLAQLAKQFNVTEAEVKQFVTDWLVWFDDVKQAFRELTSEGGLFFDLTWKQADTVAWKWSNLWDSATQLWEKVSTWLLPIFEIVVDTLLELATVVENNQKTFAIWSAFIISTVVWKALFSLSASLFAIWTRAFGVFIAWLASSRTALLAFKTQLLVTATLTWKLSTAVLFGTKALASFRIALAVLAWPIWIFVALVGTAIAWVVKLNQVLSDKSIANTVESNTKKINSNIKSLQTETEKLRKINSDLAKESLEWNKKIIDSNEKLIKSKEAFQKSLEIEQKVSKELARDLDDLDEGYEAYQENLNNLKKEAQAYRDEATKLWKEAKSLNETFSDNELETYNNSLKDTKTTTDKLKDSTQDLKEENQEAKRELNKLKDSYDEYSDKLRDLENLQKNIEKSTKSFNETIKWNLRDIWIEARDSSKEIKDAINEIRSSTSETIAGRLPWLETELWDTTKDIKTQEDKKEKIKADAEKRIAELIAKQDKIRAERKPWVDVAEEVRKINEEIAKVQKEAWEEFQKEENKLIELKKRRAELEKEIAFIKNSTTQEERDEATRREWLSESERIQEDAEAEIKAKEEAEKKEQERLKRLENINKFFAERKNLTQEELDKVLAEAKDSDATAEEIALIERLWREKVALTNQKNAKIALQQEISDKTTELSNQTTEILLENNKSVENSVQAIIDKLDTALEKARELWVDVWGGSTSETSSSTPWFSEGWYTWNGAKNDVAWVVHKWEYVIPKNMVNNLPDLVSWLEKIRTWSSTTNNIHHKNSKNQTNHIQVNNQMDVQQFLKEQKFRL